MDLFSIVKALKSKLNALTMAGNQSTLKDVVAVSKPISFGIASCAIGFRIFLPTF